MILEPQILILYKSIYLFLLNPWVVNSQIRIQFQWAKTGIGRTVEVVIIIKVSYTNFIFLFPSILNLSKQNELRKEIKCLVKELLVDPENSKYKPNEALCDSQILFHLDFEETFSPADNQTCMHDHVD